MMIQALRKKGNEVEKSISSCETLPCFDSNAWLPVDCSGLELQGYGTSISHLGPSFIKKKKKQKNKKKPLVYYPKCC